VQVGKTLLKLKLKPHRGNGNGTKPGKVEKMTINKWNEKAEKIFSENADRLKAAENTENGAYFSVNGCVAYFLPGEKIYCTDKSVYKTRLASAFNADGILADNVKHGKIISNYGHRNALKLTACNGEKVAYLQEKFTREFPKNALYYVKDYKSPVLVGIWENGILHLIAAVCPVLVAPVMGNEFVA